MVPGLRLAAPAFYILYKAAKTKLWKIEKTKAVFSSCVDSS
jgi:hypothetical protein